MSPRASTVEKRHLILEAALDLFVEKGFHGTAVPEIAERAGVGAGTIYRYFESKEQLVNDLFQHWKSIAIDTTMKDFPFMAPAREQFRTFVKRGATLALEHPRAVAFLELHHHMSYLDEQSQALENQMIDLARAVIAGWRAQQIIKDLDPDVIMAIVWGALVGVQKAAWQGRLTLSLEVIDEAEECIWQAIRR